MRKIRVHKRQRIHVGSSYNLRGLNYDGKKLICGLCGGRYIFLALHVIQTHGWTPDDYREEFGLNATQPLCTPQFSEKCRRNLEARGLIGTHLNYHLTPKQHKHSLQAKMELSVHGKGKKMTMTEAKVEAQKQNQKLSQLLIEQYSCFVCGEVFFGRHCDKKRPHHYCPKCRDRARKNTIKEWRKAHPGKVHLYSARYRASHLEERRRKDREYKRKQYRLEHGLVCFSFL